MERIFKGDYNDKMILYLCYYGMSSIVQGDNGIELHTSIFVQNLILQHS